METIVYAPVSGKIVPLAEVGDPAFSGGAMGGGAGIFPSEGKVYAPFDGTVEAIYPTKHAIGLLSDQGMEILIHVGVDTVALRGEGFEVHIVSGQKVQKGELLLSFDLSVLTTAGFDPTTMIVVTNSYDYKRIKGKTGSIVKIISPLFVVEE